MIRFLRSLDLITAAGWLAVFAPLSIMLGRAIPDYTLSLIAILFLVRSVRARDFSWTSKPWVLCLLGVWVYGALRTSAVGLTPDALGLVRFFIFAVALAEWILPHKIWRDRMAASIVGTTSFLAIDALIQFIFGYDIMGHPRLGDRLTAVFRMPKVGLNLSWFFIPAAVWLWDEGKRKAAASYGLLCFTAVLLSGDRFALLYTLSILGLLTLLAPRLRRNAFVGWGVLAVLMAGVLFFFPDVRERQLNSIVHLIVDMPRTHYGLIWLSAWDIFSSSPIFGAGINQYRNVCPDPSFGPALVGPLQDMARCVMHPHNLYMEWLTELGLIGFIGLWASFAFAGRTLVNKIRADQKAILLLALTLALAMRLFPLASSPSFYIAWASMPFWLFVGWALALAKDRT